MVQMGTSGSKTIVNDVLIGVLGSIAVFYYLSASQESHQFESAKARIVLIGELNQRVRESLAAVTNSAMSDDRDARLRGIDEAIDHIDEILCDFRPERRSEQRAEKMAGVVGRETERGNGDGTRSSQP